MLSTRALVKRFDSTTAVDDVTLDVPHGQMVGIIGRSGAGKSTLLRLVNRLHDPTAGSITFDGVDVAGLRGRALRGWRARCAMIFQQFNLVGRLDVLTNVMIGRLVDYGPAAALAKRFTAADRKMAAEAIHRLDLLPQALQRTETLSGGQQQRVAIARALVQRPEIMLADEPIASLDPRSAQRVMDALRRINREDGMTVICNLHTLDTARVYCDRVVGMAAGRVVFDGASHEITSSVLDRIYGEEGTGAASEPGAAEKALTARDRQMVRGGTEISATQSA